MFIALRVIPFTIRSLSPQALLIYNFAAYVYPVRVVSVDQQWAEDLGWVIAIAPIALGLVVGAVHALCNQKGPMKQVGVFLTC